MANYGLKYKADFRNYRKKDYRLYVYQRGYTGSSKTIGYLAGCALEVQGAQGRIIDPIVKTQLRFSVVDATDKADTSTVKYRNWQEFYTPDATLYKVVLYELNGNTATAIWSGYITPDSWQESLDFRGIITITARDNIGHLKDFPFVADGVATPDANGLIEIRYIFTRAMEVIDFPMTFNVESYGTGQYSADVPCTGDGDYLTEAFVNASIFEGMDWYQVLEQTLEAIGYTFRYVGRNRCVVACLRNLPKVGHYTEATGSQTMEFYGGSLELDPAVKQINESLDYKFQEEVTFDAVGDMTYQSAPAYACIVEGLGGLPTIQTSGILDTVTDHGNTGWENGSEMLDVSGLDADDQLINSEGYDGWKQYALIPGNRSVDDPSTSFSFRTKTSAARVTVNLAPFPYAIIGGSDPNAGKVTEVQYALYKIMYQVTYQSEDGNTTRYWTGSSWANDHAHTITREYDAENEYGEALDITLSECASIESGKITITFANIVYKRWDDQGDGVYARVKSIQAKLISSRQLSSNKVTTINNPVYNVQLTRTPLFGALSRKMGFIQPINYNAGLFYYPYTGSYPVLFPYMVWFSDYVGGLVPLPVLIHQQILCYYFGAARVLSGNCAPINNARFVFDKLCNYKGVSYLLQGGTMDFFSGIITGAVLREYADFNTLWSGGAPEYSEDVIYNS